MSRDQHCHSRKLAIACFLVGVHHVSLAHADEVATSASYQLRASIVTSGVSIAANAGLGAVGVSVGAETGTVLFGGLLPALIGAAFDQARDLAPNVTDNCTLVRTTLQFDVDEDDYGNACDADLDNNGVGNFSDLAIMKKSFFKAPGPAAGKP